MSQRRPFAKEELAASLVADDRKTDTEIAKEVGINWRTLMRWKIDPAFRAKVQAIKDRYAAELIGRGLADRQNRIDALNRDWQAIETILAERAIVPEVQGAPGGTTGWVVRTLKMLGSGEFGREIEEFGYDKAVLDARLALAKQAATETGQWTEKREVNGDLIVRQYVGVPVEDV